MEVSVVIPSYNRMGLLKRAVCSVLDQTLSADEIIIVDDNSCSETKQFLRENIEILNLVHIIYSKQNVGASASRNIGVEFARNEVVAFLDSDDIWVPSKLEKQMLLLDNGNDTELVYCFQEGIRNLYRGNVLHQLVQGWIPPNPSTLLLLKSSYQKLGGFDESLKACEDHDFWFSFALNGFRVDYCDEPLTIFTDEAENRLSHNYSLRIDALNVFLMKWKGVIISNSDDSHFLEYKSDYTLKVVYPIVIDLLRKKSFLKVFSVAFKYFLFEKRFYILAYSSLLRRLKLV